MKTVLCFGDSNTHGQIPGGTPLDRFAPDQRWPGVLRRELGPDWYVLEEGLSGRTTVHNDPIEGDLKNGRSYLRPCLMSHAPIDLVILMLGTNDLKARFGASAASVAEGVATLVGMARASACGPAGGAPAVLVVTPTPIVECGVLADIFAGGRQTSLGLAAAFAAMADALAVPVLDAGTVAEVSPVDGIHFDAPALHALGTAIARKVTQMAA